MGSAMWINESRRRGVFMGSRGLCYYLFLGKWLEPSSRRKDYLASDVLIVRHQPKKLHL